MRTRPRVSAGKYAPAPGVADSGRIDPTPAPGRGPGSTGPRRPDRAGSRAHRAAVEAEGPWRIGNSQDRRSGHPRGYGCRNNRPAEGHNVSNGVARHTVLLCAISRLRRGRRSLGRRPGSPRRPVAGAGIGVGRSAVGATDQAERVQAWQSFGGSPWEQRSGKRRAAIGCLNDRAS